MSSLLSWGALVALATASCFLSAIVRADQDARAIVRGSVAAMGGLAPATSDMTAAITIVEGSTTRVGTIRVRTRGLAETNETISAQILESRIYKEGAARESRAGSTRSASMELAAGSIAVHFPLVFFQALLADPETAYEFVGTDTIADRATNHLRAWKTYASKPELQSMSEVTVKDVWIDAATQLPVKVGFRRFDGRGATYPVPVDFSYSDFRSVSGRLFPFRIEQSLNGSPWAVVINPVVTYDAPIPDDVFAVN